MNMLRRHYDACIYALENGGVFQAKITIICKSHALDFVLKAEGERI